MAERAASSVEAADLLEQVRRRIAYDSLSPEREMPVRLYSGSVRLSDSASNSRTASLFPADNGRLLGTGEVIARLGALREFLSSGFESSLIAIGEPPPGPPSLRARAGRLSIVILRKLFWWYTRSILAFGDAVSKQFHDETAFAAADQPVFEYEWVSIEKTCADNEEGRGIYWHMQRISHCAERCP